MKKFFIWCLKASMIFLMILSAIGLIYSVYYEINGYNNSSLPDVGSPADFCGVLGTMLTIVLTWQQIKDTNKKALKDSKESREKLQTSQKQFDKTIKEMQKTREESYKPDLYMDTTEIDFTIDRTVPYANINNGVENFDVINVGAGTAKNIKVEAYSDENIDSLNKNINTYLNIIDKENLIIYDLAGEGHWEDKVNPIVDRYLFPKDDMKVPLPKIYLRILRDYVFTLDDEDKIVSDPYTELPKFSYIIIYQDQEEIKYSKKVIISARCWDTRPDKTEACSVTLSVENEPAKKCI